jgi:sentrin-specific protease 8
VPKQTASGMRRMHKSVSLVRPAVVQLIKLFDPAALKESNTLAGLKLHTADLVFIPVNDNEDDTAGGSHWSLLVYWRSGNVFYYYGNIHHEFLRCLLYRVV